MFKSNTFYLVGISYIGGHYYMNGNSRGNRIEQELHKNCFNSWKNNNFPVNKWKCQTSSIVLPVSVAGTVTIARLCYILQYFTVVKMIILR